MSEILLDITEVDSIIAFGQSWMGLDNFKNDDRYLIKTLDSETLLLAVSDGMGGHPGGDIAAEYVIKSLSLITSESNNGITQIVSAIDRADVAIRNRVSKAMIYEGMGATVTAAIINQNKIWWAHVGDSRMYLLRGGVLRRITKDHSFLQDFIDSGEISEEDAASHPMAHVLDQAVGCLDGGVECGTLTALSGDLIILCTDGFYRVLPDSQILSILSSASNEPDSVEKLFYSARKKKSPDDTTMVVAHMFGAS